MATLLLALMLARPSVCFTLSWEFLSHWSCSRAWARGSTCLSATSCAEPSKAWVYGRRRFPWGTWSWWVCCHASAHCVLAQPPSPTLRTGLSLMPITIALSHSQPLDLGILLPCRRKMLSRSDPHMWHLASCTFWLV